MITFVPQRLMNFVGEDSVVKVVMGKGSTCMDTITVDEIAVRLQLRKSIRRHTVLFLGARAGGLFRNPSFYRLIERYISNYTSFRTLQEPEKFDKCYQVLSSFNEREIYEILVACLKEPVARPEDDALAEIVREDVFDVIISTNIDPFVEEAFVRAGMREPYEYHAFIPGLHSPKDIRRPETQYCTLVKVFGDLRSRHYNTASNEFVLGANRELKEFLEPTLSGNLLIVGYDPVWDAPIEHAFPFSDGDCWYVNEKRPAKNSHLARVLDQRRGRYLGGEQSSYREFIKALQVGLSKILPSESLNREPPQSDRPLPPTHSSSKPKATLHNEDSALSPAHIQPDINRKQSLIFGPVQGLVYGENNTVTINIQGNERTIPFLAPPPPTQGLVGREDLLRDLKQKLFSGGNLALSAFNGLPGVGKTALALALAHDPEVLAHFNDGILWAGLGREPNVFSHLSAWCLALSISRAEIERLTNLTSLAQTIHGAIGTGRMLLVIDDAWSTEDALAFKLGGPQCAHMVTTRLSEVAERFASEGTITVRELDEDDSLILLEQQAPGISTKAPEEVREIIQAVDGLPLPLILMGKYLRIQMKTEQPRRLRAALDRLLEVKERLQLEQPQGGLERHPSLPEGIPLSQLAVIKISDEALGQEAQQALRALSVFPSKPNSFSEKAALAVAATSIQTIDTLFDFGLLEISGPNRYTLHQTISDYAQINLTDTTAYERMVEYFIEYVEANKTDRRLIERETSNILAAVQIMFSQEMQSAFGRGARAFGYFLDILRRTRAI